MPPYLTLQYGCQAVYVNFVMCIFKRRLTRPLKKYVLKSETDVSSETYCFWTARSVLPSSKRHAMQPQFTRTPPSFQQTMTLFSHHHPHTITELTTVHRGYIKQFLITQSQATLLTIVFTK